MKFLLKAALAASIALVGCSSGTTAATTEMSFPLLVTQAVHKNLQQNGLAPFIETPDFSMNNFCFKVPEILEVYKLPPQKNLFDFAKYAVEEMDTKGGPQPNWGENERINYAMFKGINNTDHHSLCARLLITKTSIPITDWQKDMPTREMAIGIQYAAWITNEVEKRILSEVSSVKSWKSEDELKAKINQIIDRFSTDGTLGKIYKEWALGSLKGGVELDWTGTHPAPVHFFYHTSEGKKYGIAASESGIVMKSAEGTYFGEGYISGKKAVVHIKQQPL